MSRANQTWYIKNFLLNMGIYHLYYSQQESACAIFLGTRIADNGTKKYDL